MLNIQAMVIQIATQAALHTAKLTLIPMITLTTITSAPMAPLQNKNIMLTLTYLTYTAISTAQLIIHTYIAMLYVMTPTVAPAQILRTATDVSSMHISTIIHAVACPIGQERTVRIVICIVTQYVTAVVDLRLMIVMNVCLMLR